MAVISGTEKDKLVELLEDRGVKFYHACQWTDFKTYCNLGGIPSRNLMESRYQNFTIFDTDEKDKVNGVWNHVFGNLNDSGLPFAIFGDNENHLATPNIFGPILFVFDPFVFNEVDDVAICLRSAGGSNFDRNKESLSTVEEVNSIFLYEVIEDAPNERARTYIKQTSVLGANPEVSCSVKGELIPFKYLCEVIVDPITVNGKSLIAYVNRELKKYKIYRPLTPRMYKSELGRIKVLNDFVKSLLNPNSDKKSEELDKWQKRLEEKRNFQYQRFKTYFQVGTVTELENEPVDIFGNLPPLF